MTTRLHSVLAGVLASLSVSAFAADPPASDAAASPFGRFDRDGDGRLTEEEMRNGMAGIYAAYDKNGDGSLDSAELPKLKDASGQDILNKDATAIEDLIGQATDIFDKLDADSDGFLSAAEFSAAGGKPADAM